MSAPTLNVVIPDEGDPEDWADYIKVLKLGECSYCGEPKIAHEYYTYEVYLLNDEGETIEFIDLAM